MNEIILLNRFNFMCNGRNGDGGMVIVSFSLSRYNVCKFDVEGIGYCKARTAIYYGMQSTP